MDSRPDLPLAYANPTLPDILAGRGVHPVKYQVLKCQGKEILVGRLKVETGVEQPEEKKGRHAFILRRYDTDAISLTTMFRAAFPTAGEKEEKLESQWVKEHYDLAGNNGSTRDTHIPRLAGTWINSNDALRFANDYGLTPLIEIIVRSKPDVVTLHRLFGDSNHPYSNTVNRDRDANGISKTIVTNDGSTEPVAVKSPRVSTGRGNNINTSNSNGSLPTPSPTLGDANPNPSKRRREASPRTDAVSSPVKPSRRSIRIKSPAPPPLPLPPASAKLNKVSVSTPSSSPKKLGESSPGNQSRLDASEIAQTASDELHQEDLEEQARLIQKLVSERKAAEATKRKQEENEQKEGDNEDESNNEKEEQEEESSSSKKRTRKEEGEPQLEFNFKEPEVADRQVATNRRVGFKLEPRTKSVAWGVAAFAVGMGAISLLPNFM